MIFHVCDESGVALDARFEIDNGEIVFQSRGGSRGSPGARNMDYGPALRYILERVARAGHRLTGVWVDSDEARRLPRDQRAILTASALLTSPAEQFRILSRNMQTFGRPARATYGGSRVKKIRIAGSWSTDVEYLLTLIGASPVIQASQGAATSSEELSSIVDELPLFDPSSVEDGHRQILAMITRRQGQSSFRRSLLRAYDGCCAVTSCRVEPLLEAAHIHPYRGPDTNAVQNGLLLRADIHTLFDLGLIMVSARRQIVVGAALMGSNYSALAGRNLANPKLPSDRPSALALEWHRRKHSSDLSGDRSAT